MAKANGPKLPSGWRRTKRRERQGMSRWYGYDPTGLYRISLVQLASGDYAGEYVGDLQVRVSGSWVATGDRGPYQHVVARVERKAAPLSPAQRATMRLVQAFGGLTEEDAYTKPGKGPRLVVRTDFGLAHLYQVTVDNLVGRGLLARVEGVIQLTVEGAVRSQHEAEQEEGDESEE